MVQRSFFLNKFPFYALFSILSIATALRIYHLDRHGIFFDEKSTMVVSQGIVLDGANQKDVFGKNKLVFTNQEFWRKKKRADYYEAMTRSDIGNSPFYYFLLHNWLRVFGISDFSARAMSVLFSVLTVLLLYFFTKHFFKSESLSLIAAGLAAVEPFFIAYSQQARNYSLTFFLTLFATYYFLRALEADEKQQKSIKWYIFYGILAFLGLYSHFLVASVLLAHGLYVLLFIRKLNSWIAFGLAGFFAVAGLWWWFSFGGGQYTLFSLNHQGEVYLEAAINRPYNNPYGIILPATLKNVLQKSLPIFSDLWIFTNGLIDKVEGKKNIFLSLFLGITLVFSIFLYQRKHHRANLFMVGTASLVLISGFLYGKNAPYYWIMSVGVLMVYLAAQGFKSRNNQIKLNWFLLIMAFIPTLFLIFNTFRSGHTYGLTQRYSGFSFPYVIILASMALQQLWQINHWIKYAVSGVLIIQLFFVAKTIYAVHSDRSLKYNYRTEPRQPNPHYAAAQKALQLYQKGDTLLLPAPLAKFDNAMDKTYLPYSVVDAQYFNLYLPKDGIFVQKLDTINVNQIMLKKANGQKIELANLIRKRY